MGTIMQVYKILFERSDWQGKEVTWTVFGCLENIYISYIAKT